MNYRIVKLDDFPDDETSLYSIIEGEEENTVFQKFIENHQEDHSLEINDIIKRLYTISKHEGARETYFKLHEGEPGDGVSALYDEEKHLRLFCIKYGRVALILGGGSKKENEHGTAWQDDPALRIEAEKMIQVSSDIFERLRDKEIKWTNDGKDLEGDLIFN